MAVTPSRAALRSAAFNSDSPSAGGAEETSNRVDRPVARLRATDSRETGRERRGSGRYRAAGDVKVCSGTRPLERLIKRENCVTSLTRREIRREIKMQGRQKITDRRIVIMRLA